MNPRELLESLEAAGIRLTAHGDKLRYSCPPGALTDDLRALIKEHKPALLRLLNPEPPPAPEPSPVSLPPSLMANGLCYTCFGGRWWLSVHGALVCATCHPPDGPRWPMKRLVSKEEAARLRWSAPPGQGT